MHPHLAIAFFLLIPLSAHAASGALLEEALDLWESEAQRNEKDDAYRLTEIEFQASPDLFPEWADEEDGSRLEDAREERTAGFVSVRMGTREIIFADVPLAEWFAPYVREIAELGIVSGYRDATGEPTGFFGPGDHVTVEQMAKVMVYASGRLPDTCSDGAIINATASGSWSHGFVRCAESLQWSLYGDGTVDVSRPASRSEVVQTLLQAFEIDVQPSVQSVFSDVPPTLQYAAGIAQAAEDGVVSGYTTQDGLLTGRFGPDDPVTRAEFAKIITMGLQIYGR